MTGRLRSRQQGMAGDKNEMAVHQNIASRARALVWRVWMGLWQPVQA